MDVKTGDIERHGGLHVILTFLLPNRRLEAQAFGRTARQGNHGSAQYIVKVPKEYEHQDLAPMIARRDALDQSHLNSLEKDIFPVISSKDEAFKLYAEVFRSLYAKLPQNDVKRQVKLKTYGHKFSESDWTLLDAYQEYWATHCATTVNNFSGVSPHQVNDSERGATHSQLLNALKQFEKPVGLQGQNEQSIGAIEPADIFRLSKSCFLPSRYAFHYYSENTALMETTKKAENFFRLAIELDEKHAAGAYVGLAYLELLGDKLLYMAQTHRKGYKSRAIDSLEKARNILTNELQSFQLTSKASSLKQKNSQQQCQSPYEVQLYERLEVLKRYAGVINATLEFVSDTQRPVYVTSSANRDLVSWTNAYEKVLRFPQFDSSSEALFNLRCHGLRWEKDVGTDHEVKNAVSVISGRGSGVTRLPWSGHKEGRGDHTAVLITLSFANQNAKKLKALLIDKPEVIFGEVPLKKLGTDVINAGGDPDNLEPVTTVDELSCIVAKLRSGSEIFVQLEAAGVMKLLEILRENDPRKADHQLNADTITFHGLNESEAHTVFGALPKYKNPITQSSLKRLSDFYSTKFQPLQILHQLKQRGLSWTANFDELGKIRKKSMWILGAILIAELTIAAALCSSGAGTLVVPVFTGGAVSDVFKVISFLLRNFSWKAYGVAKVLGLFVGLGVVGLESLASSGVVGVESLASSGVLAGSEVDAIIEKLLADIKITTILAKVGLAGLKFLLAKVGGYLFGRLFKEERKRLLAQVTKGVEKFIEKEQSRMEELLTSFRAIKGIELDDNEFVSQSFTEFFRIWAESVGNQVNWKLQRLMESVYGSVLKEATGLALEANPLSLASLIVLPCVAYKLIMGHLNISETTLKACEALQEELEKYVRRFDLRYILTTFCGLTMEQVVKELSVPADAHPPFSQQALPDTIDAFGSITREQLEDAKAIVNRFQTGSTEIVLSEFTSCLSDYVTDHLIGMFSGAISEAINSKRLKPAADPGVVKNNCETVLNDFNETEQPIVMIPSRGQPEKPQTTPWPIDHDKKQNHISETPTTLLSARITEIKASGTEDSDKAEESSTSPAAKFLAQVLLFCCLNGKNNVRLFEEGYNVEQLVDNRKPWDHGFHKIEYKLDEDRSKIVLVKVKNEERGEEWQLADDSCSISACSLLSKLFGYQDVGTIKESMQQGYSGHSVALDRMEKIAEELISEKLA